MDGVPVNIDRTARMNRCNAYPQLVGYSPSFSLIPVLLFSRLRLYGTLISAIVSKTFELNGDDFAIMNNKSFIDYALLFGCSLRKHLVDEL